MVSKELIQTIAHKANTFSNAFRDPAITRSRGIATNSERKIELPKLIRDDAFHGPWREMHPQEELYVDPNHIKSPSETRIIPIRIYGKAPQIEL